MRRLFASLLVAAVAVAPLGAQAAGSVSISGSSFLQSGSVLNSSAAGVSMTSFTFSLGTAANGIATWDSGTGGGTASNFLSNPRWFQTVTWSGLNVASGGTFNFSGLDIDWISILNPLDVNEGSIDNAGTSLANAFVSATFSDGSILSAALNQTGWTVDQQLTLGGSNVVPEPSTYALMATGLAGLAAFRRRRSQKA